VERGDEIGILSGTFAQMLTSIREYVVKLGESIRNESALKERELKMETQIKDAQLKYLQAQINPHFLFNTLNAGEQLAMMEGADKTTEFIENMADFFRYNIKSIDKDVSLDEELSLVDNYIYILNVRFDGEIHYNKVTDDSLDNTRVPSMILQPIVENAVNYGIRNIEWEGHIDLKTYREGDLVYISIADNGVGMSRDKIEKILSGEGVAADPDKNDSNGIGLGNVIERIRIFTGRDNVMDIISEGENKGTEFIIKVPMHV
jgi:sensor histidine kinase YesM